MLPSKPANRATVDGKFFARGSSRFAVKGVTYGPFAPNARKEPFPEPPQLRQDFSSIVELGANLVRIYHVPPTWFLDLAAEHDLQVLIDVPWSKHLCFLDSPVLRRGSRQMVKDAVAACGAHPAVFGFSVANEIPAEIVRWSGAAKIEEFINELIEEAKSVEAETLCTFTNYPPTEFLLPDAVDFVTFNVYLHEQREFQAYLARLQMAADTKPLLLGEFGMDSIREGETHKADFLSWQIESIFRGGLAGGVLFSFTDDWFRGGSQIEDWAFGITDRARHRKLSFAAVQHGFRKAPHFPLPRTPKVSVVVASYNGARTLEACLSSLRNLNYPDFEVILVDDGSTDNTPEIAARFPEVKQIQQSNQGLSAARNVGIRAATGEVVAFTDSDCRADPDWLFFLVGDLVSSDFIGIGGHNLLPPEDSAVASAVMVSPGGPAHVMLTDREAEHIPGCNMAFYKWVLEEIGGFDPIFTRAGDDVDVCWRLQELGHRIGFSPAGFVWHYRRSTVRAYLRQQSGYGEAEAMLARKHPEYFNSIGRSMWTGRIYSSSALGLVLERPVIYHGIFGSGFFQRLYRPQPSYSPMVFTALEYHILVTGPLLIISMPLSWLWPLPLASMLLSIAVACVAAWQAKLPKKKRRFWSKPLIAFLFLAQPITRGLARYRLQLGFGSAESQRSPATQPTPAATASRRPRPGPKAMPKVSPASPRSRQFCFSPQGNTDRYAFLQQLINKLHAEGWQFRTDRGWENFDVEILDSKWSLLRLTTTSEVLDHGRLNLRCRFQSFWSLTARIFVWSLLVTAFLLATLLSATHPSIWAILAVVPAAAGFVAYDQMRVRRRLLALLEELTESRQLAPVAQST